MKRLRIAFSWLVLAGMIALWVRSKAGPPIDFFVVVSADRSYGLGTEPGRVIGFLQSRQPSYRENLSTDVQLGFAGFRYLRITSDGMRRWNLVLPFWFLTSAAAMPALYRGLRRLAGSRRRRLGLCAACGYDLTGNGSGTCPECGRAVGTLSAG